MRAVPKDKGLALNNVLRSGDEKIMRIEVPWKGEGTDFCWFYLISLYTLSLYLFLCSVPLPISLLCLHTSHDPPHVQTQ